MIIIAERVAMCMSPRSTLYRVCVVWGLARVLEIVRALIRKACIYTPSNRIRGAQKSVRCEKMRGLG